MEVRETPLASVHHGLGAKMTAFAGWRLPLQFSSVAEEVQTARRAAAIFDISHMGVIRVSGAGARTAVGQLLTRDVSSIPANCGSYALLCNESGGTLDDVWVMSEADDGVWLVVNAVNHRKDLEWISGHLGPRSAAAIEDQAGCGFGLALQGPHSQETMEAAGFRGRMPTAFGAFSHGTIADLDLLVSRTGYTGEDGFEIFGAAQEAARVWLTVADAGRDYGLLPAGLAARDVLRQEMGYPLWGQDLGEQTSPIEAGLGWAVDWDHEFVGRRALETQEPTRHRIGLRIDDAGVARSGSAIAASGSRIGRVTSGTYSHNLGASIGQGYVEDAAGIGPGDRIEVESRGRWLRARIAGMPFVPRQTRRSWRQAAKGDTQ